MSNIIIGTQEHLFAWCLANVLHTWIAIWLGNCNKLFLHDDTLHMLEGLHASWTFLVLQQQAESRAKIWYMYQLNAFKPPPPPPPMAWAAVRSKTLVLLFLAFCLLLLPLWESVIVLCFVVRCFVSILVLQSSSWGRESWLLCLICLPGVSWWLSGSSSRCHGVVCGLWLWYFLIILTYYFRKWSSSLKLQEFITHSKRFD